jgi:hypothetical protein
MNVKNQIVNGGETGIKRLNNVSDHHPVVLAHLVVNSGNGILVHDVIEYEHDADDQLQSEENLEQASVGDQSIHTDSPLLDVIPSYST